MQLIEVFIALFDLDQFFIALYEFSDFYVGRIEYSSDEEKFIQQENNDAVIAALEIYLSGFKPWKFRILEFFLRRFVLKKDKIKRFTNRMVRLFGMEQHYQDWKREKNSMQVVNEVANLYATDEWKKLISGESEGDRGIFG